MRKWGKRRNANKWCINEWSPLQATEETVKPTSELSLQGERMLSPLSTTSHPFSPRVALGGVDTLALPS